MKLSSLSPKIALNKAFLKVKPLRPLMDAFKENLIQLLDRTNDTESEEFHKNLITDFLKKTYYEPGYFINTKGRNDLVIHNGNTAKTSVGVIIEAKKPTNKGEMISSTKINTKAFQELVLYYLRERITHKNLEVKHLVATNINEWFIFDATLFDRLFAQNKSLVKQFTDFEEGRLADTKTDFFYKEIAEPCIGAISSEITFTYFNIQDYQNPLRNNDKKDDHLLIALFKLLSPEHLLKLPFANDSNNLDKRFYTELLHIIGLTEVKDGSKKLIDRNKEGERHTGTILEDAIIQLDSLDKLSRLSNSSQYGANTQERLFNVALELSITWINRILFLKLLEAQLITYHKGDKSYAFLNLETVRNYDDLNSLFFQVLARKHQERNPDVKKVFEKVPYLNSSLFEPTDLEQLTLFISNLKDDKSIPVISSTVLKDKQGKKLTVHLPPLEYLFLFLDAYDFSSEGSEEIQEDNKTLINASVLGLIFEKINGYKDGSFFTPGFITMYMCRETIRKAVVQKFNEAKKWNCCTIEELYDKIHDRNEANAIVNSLKICDPAVGSGHFLVSALNEVIAIKNDLKILQDREGKRLKEYHVEVVNDELIVTDEEGELFEYNPSNKEAQRIQETLFHEKQTIIENCLFGVDINANSVKICRLRLWIELLKSAYYKPPSPSERGGGEALETLPNIDINIKCGNSLVSRFAIDADLKQALKKSKWTIDAYKIAVDTYRNAGNKEQKREMEKLIADIKSDFRSEISSKDPKVIKLRKLSGDLFTLTNQSQLFEMDKKEKADWNKKVDQLTEETKKLEVEIESIKANKIFENAFEWRFEFPEVLNDDGDFVGFDVVIGNPPYLRVREESEQIRKYYFDNYSVSENQLDLYHLFIERCYVITKKESVLSLIVPNAFLANQNNIRLRQFILANFSIDRIIEVKDDVFEEASVEVLIFIFNKPRVPSLSKYYIVEKGSFYYNNSFDTNAFENTPNNNFTVTVDRKRQVIIAKILSKSVKVSDLFKTISGIKEYQVGKGKPPQNDAQVKGKVFNANSKVDNTYLPELRGKNLSKYSFTWENEYISYGTWLAEPRVPEFFEGDKILIRQIPAKESLIASFIKETYVVDQTAYIAKPKSELDILFYLGVLNSKLLFWYFQNINNEFDQLFPKIKVKEFNALPLPSIEYATKEISSIVSNILELQERDTKSDISQLENQIDQLIYQLYDLTAEEIAIIENSSK
ncbi:MAG: Eco57I restriction-modification methylase domain-containing protein [Bacteroidia bacterium]|nr:Eco57I restriction-modification methylase domain-containing protein [Bacteroidia bacterium]